MSFAAEATNLEEVFTQGELTGTIGWFGQHIDAKGDTANSGFSNGYLNVGFETAPLHGVSVGVSGWGAVLKPVKKTMMIIKVLLLTKACFLKPM